MRKFTYQKLEENFPCMVMYSFHDELLCGAMLAKDYDDLVWNLQEQVIIKESQ